MESEWPYRAEHWEGHDEFVVTGPGWDKIGSTYSKREAEMGAMFANLAYAEGRKAAEKDFEELLMHANAMAFCSPSAIYLKFLDWKRARGIE